MTTVTNDQINHRLATDPEVMGWKDMLVAGYFLDDSFVMYKNSWNPTSDTHLHQAMMCVEKLALREDPIYIDLMVDIGQDGKVVWKATATGSDLYERVFDKSPAMAVSRVILEALDGRA